jgi:multidrug efflux pump subunit AcrA (membrane-fusion protein)
MGRTSQPVEGVVVDSETAGTGPAVNVDTGEVTAPSDPLPEVKEPDDKSVAALRREDRIAEAQAALANEPAKARDVPPVYDERGNVRPRGTKGARSMTYAERVKIAKRLASGETIATTAELGDARTRAAAKDHES